MGVGEADLAQIAQRRRAQVAAEGVLQGTQGARAAAAMSAALISLSALSSMKATALRRAAGCASGRSTPVGSVSALFGKVLSTLAARSWEAVETISGASLIAGSASTWSRR